MRALSILTTAQVKAGNPELPVLSNWIADRIQPLIDLLHSRTTRKEVKDKVQRVASRGDLLGILKIVADIKLIKEDAAGFQRAVGRHFRNAQRIEKLNERGTLQDRAKETGSRIAFYIAFIIFTMRIIAELQAGGLGDGG